MGYTSKVLYDLTYVLSPFKNNNLMKIKYDDVDFWGGGRMRGLQIA